MEIVKILPQKIIVNCFCLSFDSFVNLEVYLTRIMLFCSLLLLLFFYVIFSNIVSLISIYQTFNDFLYNSTYVLQCNFMPRKEKEKNLNKLVLEIYLFLYIDTDNAVIYFIFTNTFKRLVYKL